MSRLVRLVVHNWPLKLAAIVLAVLLYGGLILSASIETFQGRIPITVLNPPADAFVMGDLPDVTTVRYLVIGSSPPRVTSASFSATIDLAGVETRPGAPPVSVPVRVQATDPSVVQVVDFEPSRIQVALDPLVSKEVPVRVDRGTVPPGLEIREPVVSADVVTASGPESFVRLVVAAEARVAIPATGVDVNELVDLVPVDASGSVVSSVELAPASVRVTIQVGSQLSTRAVPVNAVVTGTPADGYEITAVAAVPAVVTVGGEASLLDALVKVDTEPVAIGGARDSVVVEVALQLPAGVEALDVDVIRVEVTIAPLAGSRSFEVGVSLGGADPALRYVLGADRAVVTVGGTLADLDALDPTRLVAIVDVDGLGPGTARLPLTVTLPDGVRLVAVAPAEVEVTIVAPPSPTPAPTPIPTEAPTPSPETTPGPTPAP
ncbi:MAG: CdaR family protein [Chloroflexi bacterium]|nr:CdaR family protein [Chloroflexota bacterium]